MKLIIALIIISIFFMFPKLEKYVVSGRHKRYMYPWYYNYGRYDPWYSGISYKHPKKYQKLIRRWHSPYYFY